MFVKYRHKRLSTWVHVSYFIIGVVLLISKIMALPSSRRPAEIEEELQEENEVAKLQSLKIKLNLNKIFMESMVGWYEYDLSPEVRKKLKKRDVIKRAHYVCRTIKLIYEKLPRNWLRVLHDEHGVAFQWLHPAEIAKKRAIRRLKRAAISGRVTMGALRRQIEDLKAGIIKPADIEPELTEHDTGIRAPNTSELFNNSFSSKFIDLSNEPPPEFWVKAYLTGQHLPRILRMHTDSATSQTVIFYDYDSLDCKEMHGTQEVHEANNFLSWKR